LLRSNLQQSKGINSTSTLCSSLFVLQTVCFVLSLQADRHACELSLFKNPISNIAPPVEQSHPDGVATQFLILNLVVTANLIALVFKDEQQKVSQISLKFSGQFFCQKNMKFSF
jgi:hypothetical protein